MDCREVGSARPHRSPERLEGTRTTGQIKFYTQEKGYGFIICKDVDTDVFFSD